MFVNTVKKFVCSFFVSCFNSFSYYCVFFFQPCQDGQDDVVAAPRLVDALIAHFMRDDSDRLTKWLVDSALYN